MKNTVTTFRKAKEEGRRLSMLTAYDYSTAKLMDEAGIEGLLVGDSLGMTMLGYDDTLPVTMDDMVHHARAVARGAREALVVADMPFMSYHLSPAQAVVFRQGLSGSGDPPLLAQPGGGGAGHVRQLPGQPGVQPAAGVLRSRLQRPRLHGPCLSCRISRRTIGNRLPPARRRTPRRCPPR